MIPILPHAPTSGLLFALTLRYRCALDEDGWQDRVRSDCLRVIKKHVGEVYEPLLRDCEAELYRIAIRDGLQPGLFHDTFERFEGKIHASR